MSSMEERPGGSPHAWPIPATHWQSSPEQGLCRHGEARSGQYTTPAYGSDRDPANIWQACDKRDATRTAACVEADSEIQNYEELIAAQPVEPLARNHIPFSVRRRCSSRSHGL